jgi:hypothetical protein
MIISTLSLGTHVTLRDRIMGGPHSQSGRFGEEKYLAPTVIPTPGHPNNSQVAIQTMYISDTGVKITQQKCAILTSFQLTKTLICSNRELLYNISRLTFKDFHITIYDFNFEWQSTV